MKDEWVFSNLNYIKIKIHNQLTKHLDLYVQRKDDDIKKHVLYLKTESCLCKQPMTHVT
jgi:hypothetical protein